MFWTAVHCFDLPRIDRRGSTWFELSRTKYMKIDLNGNENLSSEIQVIAGSSYRGLHCRRCRENLFWLELARGSS